MSEIKLNKDALRHLTDNPSGKIARHIKEKADEITELARDEAWIVTKRQVPRDKFENMVDDSMISPSIAVIGIRPQIDSRPPGPRSRGGRKKSITQYLAEKAVREKGDSWMTRAIRKHGYFKRRT